MASRFIAALMLFALLGWPALLFGQGGGGQGGADDERIARELGLRDWSLATIEALEGDGPVHMRVALGETVYDMVLAQHSVRAPGFRVMLSDDFGELVEAPLPPVTTYRGHLVQAPNASASATIRNGQIDAMILLDGAKAEGERSWFIQPLNRTIEEAPATVHIVYRASDAPADHHHCGGTLPGGGPWPPIQPGGDGGGPEGTLIAKIAIDADFAFYQQNGGSVSATTSDVEGIMNSVSNIYEAETSVTFQITQIIVRTTNSPYTSGVTSGNLLNQFRNHWNSNHASVDRHLAHLFTGITTSDGSVIGLAWLSVVCNQSLGYAFSRSRFSGTMSRRIGLTAHEIGHNFSAEHCNEASSSCSPCAIMCSGIGGCGGNSTSLACSAPRITSYANAAQCLSSGCTSPLITTQPTSRTVDEGESVSFAVAASGSGPLSYQWQRNGQNVTNGSGTSGATSAVLMINPALASHAGTYRCIITNSCGDVTSQGATLTVNTCTAPAITSQPLPRTVDEGEPVSFSVTASGTGPLSYQWRRNGSNLSNGNGISGATSSTLQIASASELHAGEYECIVSNSCGSVASQGATLSIGACTGPEIITSPVSRSVTVGGKVVFSIEASGPAPLSYRWQRHGVPLNNGGGYSGVTTDTLTIDPASVSHAGEFRCVVTNSCGSAASGTASLTVLVPPAITTQPVSRSVCEGESVQFSVAATGTAPLSYQWRRNGQNLSLASHISGVTTSTLTINPSKQGDTGTYTVVVSNSAGSLESQQATLTVTPAATISQQPTSQNVPEGQRVTLSAGVGGSGSSSAILRWRKNGQDLVNTESPPRIFGANSTTLTITPVKASDAGQYTLHVEYACGTVESQPAMLTVVAPTPATLAWWRFEEGANGSGSPGELRGNRRATSEVNSPDVDLRRGSGSPEYVLDVPGPQVQGVGDNRMSMRFDGSSSLRLAADNVLNFGAVNTPQGEFTIEMFVKIKSMAQSQTPYVLLHRLESVGPIALGYDMVVLPGTPGGGAPGLLGRLSMLAGDGLQASGQTSPARIDDGEWHHIAWRRYFDGQTARFDVWVDYQMVATASGAAVASLWNEADFWIGRGSSASSNDYLVGWLDEIRISDRPLLPQEFLRVVEGATCYANCTGKTGGTPLNIDDFACFIQQFTEAQSLPHEEQVNHYANCDGSTSVPVLNIGDFVCFIERFTAGCP